MRDYYRPETLEEALALLRRGGAGTRPLAGGTWLVPQLRRDLPNTLAADVDAVLDLSGLDLDYVKIDEEADGAWLHLGAMTTLSELVQHPAGQWADGLLAEAAYREGPLNLRNTATIAGCIMRANPESELLLALLVLAADVIVNDGSEHLLSLSDVLSNPQEAIGRGLIVEIRLPRPKSGAKGVLERVARTPADASIVGCAVLTDGKGARIAIGGVASQPLLLAIDSRAELSPVLAAVLADRETIADFRGSAEYRRSMAQVLADRALARAMSPQEP